MTDYWVITLMGDDQPQLIAALTDIVAEHQGSWMDSRIAQMADKFVGILGLSIPQSESASLQDALESFADMRELAMHIRVSSRETPPTENIARIKITAHERTGIMQSISQVLNELKIQTHEVETHCDSAPWGGETLFTATLKVDLPEKKTDPLQQAIEALGDDFMIDIEPSFKCSEKVSMR